MKKMVTVAVLVLVLARMFGRVVTTSVLANENYEDHSQEFSKGPGEAPDDGMARDDPRLRFKIT